MAAVSPPRQRDGTCNLLHSATDLCCSGITVLAYTPISVSVFASQSTTRWVIQSTTLCNRPMLRRHIIVCIHALISLSLYSRPSQRDSTGCAICYTLQQIYVAQVLLCLHTCISVFLYSPPSQRDGSYNLLHSATDLCGSGITMLHCITGITHAYLCRVRSLYSPCSVSSFASGIIIATQATLPNEARLAYLEKEEKRSNNPGNCLGLIPSTW